MIIVERAAPLLTIQDRGREGYLAAGVTHSGPLDALALDVANALVANRADAAVFEGCLGGGSFRCDEETTFAITGADVVATLDGNAIASYAVHVASRGSCIAIDHIARGVVWYLAVRGGIDVPLVLGSRATLLAAALGGADGKPLRSGQHLGLRAEVTGPARRHTVPAELRSRTDGVDTIALCDAPRSDALTSSDWDAFYSSTFVVSRAMSRTGYRLEGPVVPSRLAADLASEPACAGAMQLPPEGQPIVLMADHPTIGGYPVIGVVPAHALGTLAQRAPGTPVRFEHLSLDGAVAARMLERNTLSQWLSRH